MILKNNNDLSNRCVVCGFTLGAHSDKNHCPVRTKYNLHKIKNGNRLWRKTKFKKSNIVE